MEKIKKEFEYQMKVKMLGKLKEELVQKLEDANNKSSSSSSSSSSDSESDTPKSAAKQQTKKDSGPKNELQEYIELKAKYDEKLKEIKLTKDTQKQTTQAI